MLGARWVYLVHMPLKAHHRVKAISARALIWELWLKLFRFPCRWVIGDPAVMFEVGKVFCNPRPYAWHESRERHRTWEGGGSIRRHTRAIHGVAVGKVRERVTQ